MTRLRKYGVSDDDRGQARRVAVGMDGLVNTVQNLAWRRPAAYLLGCAAAGFAAATLLINAMSMVWSMTCATLRGVGHAAFRQLRSRRAEPKA